MKMLFVSMPMLFAQSNHNLNSDLLQSQRGNAQNITHEDCGQGNDSNYYESGMNITAGASVRTADDFYVSPDNVLAIDRVELVVITPVHSFEFMNFNFYEDSGGAPGALIASLSNVSPSSLYIDGTVWGFNAFTVQVDINLEFEGGPSGAYYWMQPEVIIESEAYWESTTAGVLGSTAHASIDNGPWEPEPTGAHGVFKLHCGDVVGVNPIEQPQFSYYPNPVTNVLHIDTENTIESLSVFNMLGQQVLVSKDIVERQIDVSTLSKGSYMLRLTFENGIVETIKVVKE